MLFGRWGKWHFECSFSVIQYDWNQRKDYIDIQYIYNIPDSKNKYPEVDDVVMVNVQQIAEMECLCQVLEYDNIKRYGFSYPVEELDDSKLIRVGERSSLFWVDIDLSKKKYLQICIMWR